MKRSLIFALPLLVFFAVAGFLWQALGKNTEVLPSALINQSFPSFQLTSLLDAQQIISDQQLQGQPAIINVWATWCPSCLVEHPLLNALAKEGVRIIGINYKDDRALATQYLQARGNPFAQVIFDDKGNLGFDLGVYGAPETYIVDAKGVIRERFVGVLTEAVWRQQLGPIYQQLVTATDVSGVKP
jgi:cytochrome c biogenesis protein CcmG/thiol:disulfide interchange protein DsbE